MDTTGNIVSQSDPENLLKKIGEAGNEDRRLIQDVHNYKMLKKTSVGYKDETNFDYRTAFKGYLNSDVTTIIIFQPKIDSKSKQVNLLDFLHLVENTCENFTKLILITNPIDSKDEEPIIMLKWLYDNYNRENRSFQAYQMKNIDSQILLNTGWRIKFVPDFAYLYVPEDPIRAGYMYRPCAFDVKVKFYTKP